MPTFSQGSRRQTAASILAGVLAVVLVGCGSNGIQSVPLPGGVNTGDDPHTYTVRFDDILDLVPQSVVKSNGIPVGRVTKIEVPRDAWDAQVTIEVQNEIELSAESTAAIQQTALLGEKFVALSEPEDAETLPRQNPAQPIPLERTRTATDIEQVLGMLSMLLNGGGINQLEPIVTELNTALDGRSGEVKELLNNAQSLIEGLNQQRDDIIGAIEGLSTLSARANDQTEQIERILDELPAGVAVLEEQRPQLVELLTKLDDLGEVGTDVLGRSREELITSIRALRPVLSSLAESTPALVDALPIMLTYPFPDELVPAVHGDSANLFISVDLRILNQLEALGVGQGDPEYSPPPERDVAVDPNNPWIGDNGPRYGWPTISLLPPSPNSRPGPNTPPSGGSYSSGVRPASNTQPFPSPPAPDQKFTDGFLWLLQGGGA